MKEMRMKKLLIMLDEWFGMFSYYDDDTDSTVIDGYEAECYNDIMQNEEMHLLTAATVKAVIHIAFSDWEEFVRLQHKYKAFA
ncbi:MAG TPA: hypothetical protein DEP65_01845 [Ruminococcus sp.]|nr:hypothetical protein [Ruminococcus sp.]